MSFHSLLDCIILNEKSVEYFFSSFVCMCLFLSCCFEDFSFYYWIFSNLILICLAVFFVFILLGIHWTLGYTCLYFSANLESFQPLFLQIFFCFLPLSGTMIAHILNNLILSHISLSSCSFFKPFFFLSVLHFE